MARGEAGRPPRPQGFAEAIAREDAAWERVKTLAVDLAEVVGPIWHWGDGYGGAVYQVIEEALDQASVARPPRARPQRRTLSASRRIEIFARDGYRCEGCNSPDGLTVDHIIPISKGGGDEAENLRTLCRPCNSRKGAS